MNKYRNKLRLSILPILLSIGLYGCATGVSTEILDRTQKGLVTPYLTVTPSKTPVKIINDSADSPDATPIPSPTPTPFLYAIAKDDTLTSIAYRHGVKLNDLIAENPGIDPNFLTIGITITIPITGSNSTNLFAPTPIPLSMQKPICYANSDGGLWCLSLVENTQPFDVENVTVQITLQTPQFVDVLSQEAVSPLNLLPTGMSIPIAAYFPPPIPADYQPMAEMITVLPVPSDNQRYIDQNLIDSSIIISENQLQADVSGEVTISSESLSVNQVWIIAVAYDMDGKLVGFRKWESNNLLLANETLPFDIKVYSLGPQIKDVDILVEARP
jgi:LysM repeat protein